MFVKPWTYMNNSGTCVAAYARHYQIPLDAIFVIVDDLNLPLGRIRVRPGGSPGGHNGLKSLLSCLGSEGFPRLRIGIAVDGASASEMVDPDFVLSGFSEDERRLVDPALADAVAATRSWIEGAPLQVLMSEFNNRERRTDDGPSGSD